MTTVVEAPTRTTESERDFGDRIVCHLTHDWRGSLCGESHGDMLASDLAANPDRHGRCGVCGGRRCPRCAALYEEGVR